MVSSQCLSCTNCCISHTHTHTHKHIPYNTTLDYQYGRQFAGSPTLSTMTSNSSPSLSSSMPESDQDYTGRLTGMHTHTHTHTQSDKTTLVGSLACTHTHTHAHTHTHIHTHTRTSHIHTHTRFSPVVLQIGHHH